MASSSSSYHITPTSCSQSYKYDVFLSFRGEDTRKTFVDHLYSTLEQHLINVYKDDKTLPRGDSINQSLFKAIEESQIAIIIFSKNYPDSSWCLDELTHIMKCRNEKDQIVIPIFYDVEPTDVRNQKMEFGKAFAKQEAKNVTKGEIWRNALVDASNIAGWEPKNIDDGHESQFIAKIVDTVMDRLFVLNFCVDEDLVGMRSRFQDLESLLDIGSGGVCMVGVWGVGGGGKTTLATSVFMKISEKFDGHCIVENVREGTKKYGLNKLQENMLSALFNRESKVGSVIEGKRMIKKMLHRRKVLILLDDVDKLDQLEALIGKHNWFGSGSRILITTRDEHLLRTHMVDHVYPVKLLSDDEAIELFKKHAYNEKVPLKDYVALSLHVVSYASGLPLSLKVLGSFLYDKNKKEWNSTLKKLKEIPNPEVMNILKISYDGLEPYEKELFLDIACFWRLEPQSEAMHILEVCGLHPGIGIKVLIQKSLITTIDNGFDVRFDMHDLVQEMGHYIVRGEYPKNPEKHKRVWKHEDIKEICSRDAAMENDIVEAIKYFDTRDYGYSLPLSKLVSNMKQLRWLSISVSYNQDGDEWPISLSNELRYVHLNNYRVRSPFLNSFLPMKLVVLKLTRSMQKELWKGYQHLPHLEILDLREMKNLTSTPDFNGLPCLQKLIVNDCMELKEIHPSLGNHTSLEYLKVSDCNKLKVLPTISHMKNIRALLIIGCDLKDGEIPRGIDELSSLQVLNLSGNKFSRLDFSLSQLTGLKILDLSSCDKLLELPELPSSLAILRAHNCESLTNVGDFSKNCEELCQVSLKDGWSDKLLRSMLKGMAIENGSMHMFFGCDLEIAKGFNPHLVRGMSYRLELPENWCTDFSGFLMCAVCPRLFLSPLPSVLVRMKHVSGMGSEDDHVVWEESVGDKHTRVWYVSFGSLRDTTWWDETCNAISFSLISELHIRGFGARLVDKISRNGRSETSTDSSSQYTPKIKIQHDSPDEILVNLEPYERKFVEY